MFFGFAYLKMSSFSAYLIGGLIVIIYMKIKLGVGWGSIVMSL